MTDNKTTKYGFKFGAALVERAASHNGYVVISVTTPKQLLDITVTPAGIVRLGVPHKRAKAQCND